MLTEIGALGSSNLSALAKSMVRSTLSKQILKTSWLSAQILFSTMVKIRIDITVPSLNEGERRSLDYYEEKRKPKFC